MRDNRKFHDARYGRKVIGKIIRIKGHCTYGLKLGDEFELSSGSADGICGYFYYNIYPYIMTLQFGGQFPPQPIGWHEEFIELNCPDIVNAVTIQLRPVEGNFYVAPCPAAAGQASL